MSQTTIHAEIAEHLKEGVYSNAVSVTITNSEVVLDFGYLLPTTSTEEQKHVKIVSRVNMTINSAENFLAILQKAILDFHEKKMNKQNETPQSI